LYLNTSSTETVVSMPSILRDDAPAALSDVNHIVLTAPAAVAPAPANPATILAQANPSKPTTNRNKILAYVAGGLITAQVVLPPGITPSAILGGVAAAFYTPIMQASMTNQLTLARQQALAEKIAELEARRADALGNCMWAGIFEGGDQVCRQLVNQRFNSSLADARSAAGVR